MEQNQLNYTEFIGMLRQKLYQIIPEEMGMEVHKVTKNNSIQLDSLVLYSRDCSISPNFYMQDYYNLYQKGENLTALAGRIYDKWEKTAECSEELMPDLSFEKNRDQIIYRLVNAERNSKILEESPYIPFFDLAVVFYDLINEGKDGIQSIRISNQLMESWKLNTEKLLALATENTPRLFPAQFFSVERFLYHAVFSHTGIPEEDSLEEEHYLPEVEPYVLTNTKGINGASVWLYPKQMEQVSEHFRQSLYILPSSIHELIIVPEERMLPEQDMLELVHTVNQEDVSQESYLSDNIYYYDMEQKAVKMITQQKNL